MRDVPALDDYPARTYDKLRYGDTDRQGHVNNAVFSSMLETGRVEVLFTGEGAGEDLADAGCSFVIVRIALDLLGEITWPGTVEIGTRVAGVGRSSVTFEQGLFQHGSPVAHAESVIVQLDGATGRSRPLSERAVDRISTYAAGRSPVEG